MTLNKKNQRSPLAETMSEDLNKFFYIIVKNARAINAFINNKDNKVTYWAKLTENFSNIIDTAVLKKVSVNFETNSLKMEEV